KQGLIKADTTDHCHPVFTDQSDGLRHAVYQPDPWPNISSAPLITSLWSCNPLPRTMV
ncbi:MAG: hypothetical protein ACI92Z_003639, partial [Paracoccaceae bacterium]